MASRCRTLVLDSYFDLLSIYVLSIYLLSIYLLSIYLLSIFTIDYDIDISLQFHKLDIFMKCIIEN